VKQEVAEARARVEARERVEAEEKQRRQEDEERGTKKLIEEKEKERLTAVVIFTCKNRMYYL
jgi:hypothetical protein